LNELDKRDVYHGYKAGLNGAPEPSIELNRDYWHGWRNGMVDGGHWKNPDEAQRKLAHEFVKEQP
jgi:ribosome modulation factor